jgi:hypothetical protein
MVVPPWYRRKGFDVVRARTALDVGVDTSIQAPLPR